MNELYCCNEKHCLCANNFYYCLYLYWVSANGENLKYVLCKGVFKISKLPHVSVIKTIFDCSSLQNCTFAKIGVSYARQRMSLFLDFGRFPSDTIWHERNLNKNLTTHCQKRNILYYQNASVFFLSETLTVCNLDDYGRPFRDVM